MELDVKTENQVKFWSLLNNTKVQKRCRLQNISEKSYEGVHFLRKHLSVLAVEDPKSLS